MADFDVSIEITFWFGITVKYTKKAAITNTNPRQIPNIKPKFLSKPLKIDFCTNEESNGVNIDTINRAIAKITAKLAKINNSQLSPRISPKYGICRTRGCAVSAKINARIAAAIQPAMAIPSLTIPRENANSADTAIITITPKSIIVKPSKTQLPFALN